jgi:hypothetical protein
VAGTSSPRTTLHDRRHPFTVAALVTSLDEALAVFHLQQDELEAVRRHSDRVHEVLMRSLEGAQLSEQSLGEARQRLTTELQADFASPDHHLQSARLSLRWETALCDAFDALIRLYAAPELQEPTIRVAARLRAIRLMAVSDTEADMARLPRFLPKPGTQQPGGMRSMLGSMQSMEPWHRDFQASADAKLDATRVHLEASLAEALAMRETLLQ